MATFWQGDEFIKGVRFGGSNDNDGKAPKIYRGADQIFPANVPYVEDVEEVEELTYKVIITPTNVDRFFPLPNKEGTGLETAPQYNEDYFVNSNEYHEGKLFRDRTDNANNVVASVQDFVVEDGQIKYNFVNPENATFNQNSFAYLTGENVPKFGQYLTAVDITAVMGEPEVQPNPPSPTTPYFGLGAFSNTTMTSVKVKGITHMSHTMFSGVNGATSVSQTDDTAGIYLPDLTDMSYAKQAFLNSSTLTSIVLPNVTTIGAREIFNGCSTLRVIDLRGLNPDNHQVGGVTRLSWNAVAFDTSDVYDPAATYDVFKNVANDCVITIPAAFSTNYNDGPDPELLEFMSTAKGEHNRSINYI